MRLDALYIRLFRAVLREFSTYGLELLGIHPPAVSEGEALLRKLSLLGVADLRLRDEPLKHRFPYPTPRGTFILRGREHSATLRAIPVATSETSFRARMSDFRIWPTYLLRLRRTLSDVLSSPADRRGKTTSRKKDPELPTAIELEARLNRTSYPGLTCLDQTNLLAELSDCRKISFPGGAHAPARRRAVDESHRGRLCPLETPESEKIGLRRHLARGASLAPTKNGLTVRGSPEIEDGSFLGVSASLVPFIQHNDGARALMGAKNLKQAVPLEDPEVPLVRTGWERSVAESSARLIVARHAGIVDSVAESEMTVRTRKGGRDRYTLSAPRPSSAATVLSHSPRVGPGERVARGDVLADWTGTVGGQLALGRNALVAYVPYRGMNFEDGIVVSESLAARFTSRHLYEFELELLPGESLAPRTGVLGKSPSLPSGIVAEGATVRRGSLLASKRKACGEVEDLNYDKLFEGKVVRSWVLADRAVVWVEALRTLETGDKLTGRHGNKGVVTQILPDEAMPFFRANNDLHRVEACLSPMGVVSRMNLGQLYETHYGWLLKTRQIDDADVGRPFRPPDREKLRELLKHAGLPEGKAELFARSEDGESSLGFAVVGYQYLSKLNHLARDKIHVRGAGGKERYSRTTGQPVKGKRQGGGQRLGEMEIWALLAHDAPGILAEMLSAKSDDPVGREWLLSCTGPGSHGLPEEARVGVPHSLLALRDFLRGLGLELELLSSDGSPARNSLETESVRIRRAEEAEILQWSGGAVDSFEKLESGSIFGERQRIPTGRIGHIPLASAIPHPLLAGQITRKEFRARFDDLLEETGEVKIVPVIPLVYRPCFGQRRSGLNKRYADVLAANLSLRRAASSGVEPLGLDRVERLYRAVERLFTGEGAKRPTISILGHLDGKRGLLRRHLLGKRQDYSARAVIVPDPSLRLDECGLPLVVLAQLFRGQLRGELAGRGVVLEEDVTERVLAGTGEERTAIRSAVETLIRRERPLVLLNRQPSLHKYSLLAFQPRIRSDYVISIPPMVCAGFNADFDGDTIAVYLPMTRTAQREARQLLPSRHLFKSASGDLLLHLTQDLVLGPYILSGRSSTREDLSRLLGSDVDGELTKGELKARLAGICRSGPSSELIDKLGAFQHAAFAACTSGDSSFSVLDIEKTVLPLRTRGGFVARYSGRRSLSSLRARLTAKGLQEPQTARRLAREVGRRLDQIEERTMARLSPENSFSRLFLSGARGDKKQLRQVSGLIGYVYREDGSPIESLIAGCFLDGISEDDYWTLCSSTRRTMLDKKLRVREAGALTRHLVEGSFDLEILTEDCHTRRSVQLRSAALDGDLAWAAQGRVLAPGRLVDGDALKRCRGVLRVRSPLVCEARGGVCQRCYGLEPTTDAWAPIGCRIGILAGQSVGEQGTQLSMRTFHTGGLALPIDEVIHLFVRGRTADEPLDEVFGASGAQGLLDRVLPLMVATYGRAVLPVHFEVLLRAMTLDGSLRSLQRAAIDWRRRGILAAASYRSARQCLREALSEGAAVDHLVSLKAWVILGRGRKERPHPEDSVRSLDAETAAAAAPDPNA